MIAVITDPHWGDLLILGALIAGTVCLAYLGIQLIDLTIAAMRDAMRPHRHHGPVYARFDHDPASDFAQHADDAQRLTHAGRDIAPEDEPSWPGKVDLLIEPVDDNPARYATGGPVTSSAAMVDESGCSFMVPLNGTLPETPAETSQPRHSADDTMTELFPVVVDEDAPADETVGAS